MSFSISLLSLRSTIRKSGDLEGVGTDTTGIVKGIVTACNAYLVLTGFDDGQDRWRYWPVT